MIFEFTSKPNFDFIAEFAAKFKVPIRDDSIAIPASIGKGSVKRIEFGEGFKLIIHHYDLTKDFTIKRNAAIVKNDLVSIFFYNNEQPIDLFYNEDKPVKFSQSNESAIQITSSDMNSVIKIPAKIGQADPRVSTKNECDWWWWKMTCFSKALKKVPTCYLRGMGMPINLLMAELD